MVWTVEKQGTVMVIPQRLPDWTMMLSETILPEHPQLVLVKVGFSNVVYL